MLPPLPPKVPKCYPPCSPPLRGGAVGNLVLENFVKTPPCSPPQEVKISSDSPPLRGGAVQNQRFAPPPPLRGGAGENLRKARKTRDRTAPPQASKSPPQNDHAPPPCQGRSFGAELLPPKGSGVGGSVPPKMPCSPPVRGVLNTPNLPASSPTPTSP